MSKIFDFSFRFGKYNNAESREDENGYLAKVTALLNLIHMYKGTIQDTPEMGMYDMLQSLSFTDNTEGYKITENIRNEIMNQSNIYIENSFVKDVDIVENKSVTNQRDLSITIRLKDDVELFLKMDVNEAGIVTKNILLDATPFTYVAKT